MDEDLLPGGAPPPGGKKRGVSRTALLLSIGAAGLLFVVAAVAMRQFALEERLARLGEEQEQQRTRIEALEERIVQLTARSEGSDGGADEAKRRRRETAECICPPDNFEEFNDHLHESIKKGVTDIVVPGVMKCYYCEYTSQDPDEFQHHMTHHVEKQKPFVCLVCCKRFTLKHHLREHTRVHTGEKPYKCGHCGDTFKWKVQLCRHLNNVHAKIL